jgi:biopolymer transport protein ExbB
MRHLIAALLLVLSCSAAQAWWNKDWTHRTKLVLDTGAQGVPTSDPVPQLALAVRLHSGNFDFLAAKPDGSDLRVLAGDDKTPLAFRIERWDGTNELATVWVLLPTVAPNSDKNLVYLYSGNEKAPAEASTATGFDSATRAAFHFSSNDAGAALTLEPNGLLGGALKLPGSAQVIAADDKLKTAADGVLTLSLWIKPDAVERGTLLQQGPLTLALSAGKVQARVGPALVEGGALKPATWAYVALTLGQGQATLYVDGAKVGQAALVTPAIEGELRLGEGITGALDELQLAATVRTPGWLALAAATQGIGGKGVKTTQEGTDEAEGGHGGYIGVLVKNLTTDAWVVIIILGVMMAVAVWVMISKAVFVQRADRANRSFLRQFRDADANLLQLGGDPRNTQSSLLRLYNAGVRELAKRHVGHEGAALLSGASINAVKAAVDADLVRETHRLNAQMVLLTIAISGGPFLGLLGTVVGVMITFAAIAAAGDVNVNAIAPGIAAALLATVAGLGVAIPALFGYNYLAARIKNISSDMQIFVDEFITRVAEKYGAP